MSFDAGGGYLLHDDEAEQIARQILAELDALDGALASQDHEEPVRYNEGNRNTEQQLTEVHSRIAGIQHSAASGMRTSAENLLKAIEIHRRNEAAGTDLVRRTVER